jgi:hypothetical protein
METQRERTRIVLCLLALAGLVGFAVTAGGGSAEPAARLAPVKKTLNNVEPRTPISSLPYTISAAGSYYLTGNLTADANGILVDANNVTIDLAGFRFDRTGFGDQLRRLYGWPQERGDPKRNRARLYGSLSARRRHL